MSMKKTDLVKQLAKKLDGRMKGTGVPGRFAQGAAEVVDRREQRRRDAAAGLVPFACKLPAELLKQLNERAATQEGGVNAVVAEALESAFGHTGDNAVSDKPVAEEGAVEVGDGVGDAVVADTAPRRTGSKRAANSAKA